MKDIVTSVKIVESTYNQFIISINSNISFNKFVELMDKMNTFDINIFEQLFINYTYPFNYDKRTFTLQFAKILYYSFKYYNNILDNENVVKLINVKIKSVYLYILKFYKGIYLMDKTLYNNSRIYSDNMIYVIIKILLFNDTYNLLKINNSIPHARYIESSIDLFNTNIIIIQILNNLTWKNFLKQLNLYKYIIKNTNDLLIVDGKLNKHIININMDTRLKKIITDPLQMFNYLRNENDYIKWIMLFTDIISRIFYNPIILKNNDFNKLGKILFLISKINIQNLENTEYIKLINYLRKNLHIVLFNDRINIKIRDIFKTSQINLGFLAKHINDIDSIQTISISDDICIEPSEITNKLNKLTIKYYKYKGKYLEMRTSEMTSTIK